MNVHTYAQMRALTDAQARRPDHLAVASFAHLV